MPNPQDIFQLAQQTATQVTASPENWRRFLYTAAHNYHTTYLNQLLIHAQRPDATACATMKYWNEQAHRKVMYGSKSIIILPVDRSVRPRQSPGAASERERAESTPAAYLHSASDRGRAYDSAFICPPRLGSLRSVRYFCSRAAAWNFVTRLWCTIAL